MRNGSEPQTTNDLTIDLERFEARYRGTHLDLTAKEFDLLKFLTSEHRRVVSREELPIEVWAGSSNKSRVVDTFVSRLRVKLRQVGHPGIDSVRKRGYHLLAV